MHTHLQMSLGRYGAASDLLLSTLGGKLQSTLSVTSPNTTQPMLVVTSERS